MNSIADASDPTFSLFTCPVLVEDFDVHVVIVLVRPSKPNINNSYVKPAVATCQLLAEERQISDMTVYSHNTVKSILELLQVHNNYDFRHSTAVILETVAFNWLIIHKLPIVHWRNHLKFPEDANLSPQAKDLICRLLCDVEHRLGTGGAGQIKAHPWFKDIVWEKLYEMEAAFKPEVNGELDTQNFMKFDEMNPPTAARSGSGPSRKIHLNPKDLSFVGYTYKNFDAVKALLNSSDGRSASPSRPSIDSIFGDSKGSQTRKGTAEETDVQMIAATEDAMVP